MLTELLEEAFEKAKAYDIEVKGNLALTLIIDDLIKDLNVHPKARLCKICNEEVGNIAVIDIVTRWEVCCCDDASYDHLVETLYHKNCVFSEGK